MTQTTIYIVVGIEKVTLIVFFNEIHCWQFRVISSGGAVFGERKLYYSPEAAEKALPGVDCAGEVRRDRTRSLPNAYIQ